MFQPLNYACLGIFQLLIIKGLKKGLVTYKTVGASVIVCVVTTTAILTEGITFLNIARQTYICTDICPRQIVMIQRFSGILITHISYILTSWLPSLIVVVVCTTWSCIIFKKTYIGHDEGLNRRIISQPIIMPLVLVIPSIISFTLILATEQLLTTLEVTDLPYWILFNRITLFIVHEII